MKTTHHCPKCNSSRIVVAEAKSYQQHSIGATNKWGMPSAVIDRYFCVDCGYTEEYAQLNKKFQKWANELLAKQQRNPDDYFV